VNLKYSLLAKLSLMSFALALSSCSVRELATGYADTKAEQLASDEGIVVGTDPTPADPTAPLWDQLTYELPAIIAVLYLLIRRRVPAISDLIEGSKRERK
jgi:hypothetical protein